ncbi:MAG: hypothetical protein SCARUB_03405 [Candidatus Scalindua rubra]|uniref:Uncharacterized protein n=1 Tax=Candidatus Scalindua rubra TaxID=1872076 RepID=A0A1E3X934_9BACT|nr:MAG: hypothetical protein SCARUB_03405 [Candidatus Scalindua rubra]
MTMCTKNVIPVALPHGKQTGNLILTFVRTCFHPSCLPVGRQGALKGHECLLRKMKISSKLDFISCNIVDMFYKS